MRQRIVRLSSRALIGVDGADWRSFLQGLITQNTDRFGEGGLSYAALLTPQGRLLYDFFVWEAQSGVVLDVHAPIREALMARLALYRLRAKVEIKALDGAVFSAWPDAGPGAEARWARDPRHEGLGWRGLAVDAVLGAAAEDEAAYDALRLSLGVPDPALDGKDSDYPLELNLDHFGAIDFKKGCFVGQETTSRMFRRGAVKSRLTPLVFDGPAPAFGSEVMVADRRAGEVRSGQDGRALALLRLDRVRDGILTVDGRAMTLDPPPWLSALFQGDAEDAP